MKGPAINCNGSVNLKCDHPLWAFALPLGTLTHGGVFGIKCLSRGRESIEEFTFLAPYIEKFCGIVVFGKFSCGTCVIVVLISDIVVFLNMRIFLLLARLFLAWLKLSNLSIFLFGFTEFYKAMIYK